MSFKYGSVKLLTEAVAVIVVVVVVVVGGGGGGGGGTVVSVTVPHPTSCRNLFVSRFYHEQ